MPETNYESGVYTSEKKNITVNFAFEKVQLV